MLDSIVIAGIGGCTGSCSTGTTAFWESGVGGVIGGLLAVVGVLVVIIAVVKGFGKVTSGKPGEALKIGLGAAVFATFLFNPALVTNLIGMLSGVVGTVIDSFGDVVDKSKN